MDTFLLFEVEAGLLHEHDDGNFKSLLFGFKPGKEVALPLGHTHFGVVVEGTVTLRTATRERRLVAGDYFSAAGPVTLCAAGTGIVCSAFNYRGMNVFGGPIEETGRLRYMNGCSDSLLVPPVKKGDPCLNYLHFPIGVLQTSHTHPSVRMGVVYRGAGECVVPDQTPISLKPGYAFVIPTNSVHGFNTPESVLDVIAFHPDSDTGMTDDDHPMINRTIVNGVSARHLHDIRTPTSL